MPVFSTRDHLLALFAGWAAGLWTVTMVGGDHWWLPVLGGLAGAAVSIGVEFWLWHRRVSR